MATKTKSAEAIPAHAEMLETARDMHAAGIMDDAAYAKITMRDVHKAEAATLAPLTGKDIRALREQARMSQAVFAHLLNLTVG
jgi:putative transcriptional regulator